MVSIFGFASPVKSELKFREYDLYQAYYCSVCKSISKRYGNLKTFGLVNEMGMLSLLLDAVSHKSAKRIKVQKTCAAHPFKKKTNITGSEYVDYAADLNIIFAYFKLKDSWEDDKNILSNTAASIIFGRAANKARKNCPSVYESIKTNINKLSKYEKENCDVLDLVCVPFAELMGDLFALAPGIEDTKLVSLRSLGYYMGKWIYLIDALYDIEKDIKKRHYNPLILRFKYKETETVAQFKERIRGDLSFLIYDALGRCVRAWEDLKCDMPDNPEYKDSVGFMDNVIYLGLKLKTEKGFLNNEPL